MVRPDQSLFLAHFTKDGSQFTGHEIDNPTIDQMSARQRLVKILEEQKIIATNQKWVNKKAVCFTECPWGSLLRHAVRYSPYGIGFSKRLVYSRQGNPVFYVNPNLFHQQNWDDEIYPFLTPFVPSYAPNKIKKQHPFNGRAIDYTHEREWRVTKDFSFQYTYLKFVVLANAKDLDAIPSDIIQKIGIEKFIYMDTYRKIEELWPTHIME